MLMSSNESHMWMESMSLTPPIQYSPTSGVWKEVVVFFDEISLSQFMETSLLLLLPPQVLFLRRCFPNNKQRWNVRASLMCDLVLSLVFFFVGGGKWGAQIIRIMCLSVSLRVCVCVAN